MDQSIMDTKLQSPTKQTVQVNNQCDVSLSKKIGTSNSSPDCKSPSGCNSDSQPLLPVSGNNTVSPFASDPVEIALKESVNRQHEEANSVLSPSVKNNFLLYNGNIKNNSKNYSKANGIYENPIEKAAEAECLLKKNSENLSKDFHDDKPVLRVQFDGNEAFCNSSTPNYITVPKNTNSDTSSSSDSSSSSSESLEISEARPPDGGYGWVIVAASFIVNLIADGVTFSFGVIYVEFLDYFRLNHGTTAWIGGIFMSVPLLSGPIASFLTDRYGCRKVTMVGSIMASCGFIISSRTNSFTVLCVTFGMLAGFGLSLCYVASVVIVAYYFDKRRSFATGLAVCGSGIGTFMFAPLIEALLGMYGWRGTTLILAGFFLNLAVCGALMRDLPWTSAKMKSLAKKRKRDRHLKRKLKAASAESLSGSNSTNTASGLQPIPEMNEEDAKDDSNANRLYSSLVNLPTYVKTEEKLPIEVIERLARRKRMYDVLMTNYPNLLTPSRSFSDSAKLNEAHLAKAAHNIQLSSPVRKKSPYSNFLEQQVSPPRTNPTRRFHTYLKNLRVHRLSVTYRGAMLNINRYRLRASSCPDIYRNSMTTIAKEKVQWYAPLWDLWDILVDMFDFSHFSDPKFLLFAISNFLLYTWYDIPYVYLKDYAIKKKHSTTNASNLISVIGVINMIGEIVLGWLGDIPRVDAGLIYAICMGLCGAVIALVPLISNYVLLCSVSAGFGFFIAANYALTCIILVELISLDRFTNAYGLLLLVQGIGNLIGPPLGGWLRDITGTYSLSFYLAGFFITISGLMLLVLPLVKGVRKLTRDTSEESDDSTSKEVKTNEVSSSPIRVDKITVDITSET